MFKNINFLIIIWNLHNQVQNSNISYAEYRFENMCGVNCKVFLVQHDTIHLSG